MSSSTVSVRLADAMLITVCVAVAAAGAFGTPVGRVASTIVLGVAIVMHDALRLRAQLPRISGARRVFYRRHVLVCSAVVLPVTVAAVVAPWLALRLPFGAVIAGTVLVTAALSSLVRR